jgi:hypothetical protein
MPLCPACAIIRALHQYEADCAAGRDQAPGYWITLEELEAELPEETAL